MNLFNKRKALMLYAEKKKEGGEPIYLPYLQSDGNQYIQDDYKFTSDNLAVDGSFIVDSLLHSKAVFGWQGRSTYLGTMLLRDSGGSDVFPTGVSTTYRVGLNHFTFEHGPSFSQLEINGTTSTNGYDYVIDRDNSFVIFGNKSTTNFVGVQAFTGAICAIRFYDNKKLVRNFRPCLNPETLRPAMYDTVNKKYYYNQGTGEFTYGAPLVKLDYIQSDADAYINTEYKATELTGIKVLWSSDEVPTSGAIFGSFNTISPKLNDRFQVVFAGGNKTYVGYGTGNTILQTSKYCDGKVHSLEINPLTKQIIADGEVVGNNIQAGDLVKRKSQKLCLFTTNQGTIRQRSTIKIHEVIITEDGMEKMHLIPYRMNSGELGMWDILAGKSYGNVSGGGISKFNKFNSLIDGKEMVKDIYALWGQGWFTTNIYPDEDAEIYMTYKYRGGFPAGSDKIFSSDKTWVGPYPERDAQMSFQYGTQLGHTEGLFVDTMYIYHVAVRGNEFEIAIDETQEHETQGGKYEKITLNKETFKSKKPLLIGKASKDTNIYSFTYINRKTKEFYQYIPVPTGEYTGSLYSIREKYVLSQDGTTDFQIDR